MRRPKSLAEKALLYSDRKRQAAKEGLFGSRVLRQLNLDLRKNDGGLELKTSTSDRRAEKSLE